MAGPEHPRPYLLTRGRVVSHGDLPLEAQVVTVRPDPAARLERRAILDLAREPLSVAEIAARLGLHLGVVRVLVSELYAEGRLIVEDASEIGVDTLRRVVHGLRSLV